MEGLRRGRAPNQAQNSFNDAKKHKPWKKAATSSAPFLEDQDRLDRALIEEFRKPPTRLSPRSWKFGPDTPLPGSQRLIHHQRRCDTFSTGPSRVLCIRRGKAKVTEETLK